ncbi:hypothetical protein ABW19_dt0201878 [Dactylella cylindrospora]|nr:hypothetical protein ABW19_dt0201878 [Dactylella cylindrospora]
MVRPEELPENVRLMVREHRRKLGLSTGPYPPSHCSSPSDSDSSDEYDLENDGYNSDEENIDPERSDDRSSPRDRSRKNSPCNSSPPSPPPKPGYLVIASPSINSSSSSILVPPTSILTAKFVKVERFRRSEVLLRELDYDTEKENKKSLDTEGSNNATPILQPGRGYVKLESPKKGKEIREEKEKKIKQENEKVDNEGKGKKPAKPEQTPSSTDRDSVLFVNIPENILETRRPPAHPGTRSTRTEKLEIHGAGGIGRYAKRQTPADTGRLIVPQRPISDMRRARYHDPPLPPSPLPIVPKLLVVSSGPGSSPTPTGSPGMAKSIRGEDERKVSGVKKMFGKLSLHRKEENK